MSRVIAYKLITFCHSERSEESNNPSTRRAQFFVILSEAKNLTIPQLAVLNIGALQRVKGSIKISGTLYSGIL
jgi:hypothetical protein